MMRSRAGNLNVRISERPAHLVADTCVRERMMSRYAVAVTGIAFVWMRKRASAGQWLARVLGRNVDSVQVAGSTICSAWRMECAF
jgi:hypothetical protein